MNPKSAYKVFVTLGFHASFYHSWRGDSPDEAGFGTDIRVVREILRILNQANARGLQARGYWDFDVYFTVQNILPEYAPDILEGIRQRVGDGLDEIVLGPYNNGANHAATPQELRTALNYAIENPYGSGLKQVFGAVTPFYRPQEAMYTTGQNAYFQEAGITALILYYSGVPFNTLSTFTPALSAGHRYNPLWLRSQPGEQPLVLFPCVGISDILEHVCLEAWLWELHEKQEEGEIQSDVLIHINADADLEAWLPVQVPRAFSWFPNLGGLEEYIQVVNRYPWAEFTVLSEYLASHPPQDEIMVRQDLADGGFDGSYPWAEKFTSLVNWTQLERARMAVYRAEALSKRLPVEKQSRIRERLYSGSQSPFFNRLIGLSTTHFGMSTPTINEERQAKASAILGRALEDSLMIQRELARDLQMILPETSPDLYVFEVYGYSPGIPLALPSPSLLRLPLVLPPEVKAISLVSDQQQSVPFSWVNPVRLQDGWRAGEVLFLCQLESEGRQTYRISSQNSGQNDSETGADRLENRWLRVEFAEECGISRFQLGEFEIGGKDFLSPFITYGEPGQKRSYTPNRFRFLPLEMETWNGVHRKKLQTEIIIPVRGKPYTCYMTYTFTLHDELPYLVIDVEAEFATTPSQDMIDTYVQRLRRPLDLKWVETAPCQIQPGIYGNPHQPLRVWKHNYLGNTSSFDLNYGQINPRNSEWDSLNHQVTAGWLAVSNGSKGLLVAENAESMVSMAFCPMRLRTNQGKQQIALNPFGSYFGRMPDYSHLGGNGVGVAFTQALSGALKPNGPSFNGRQCRFSLFLAPYDGDRPPDRIESAATSFFYPPGIVFHKTPLPKQPQLPEDLRAWIAQEEKQNLQTSGIPLPAPVEFLVNPGDRTAHLVWRQPGNLPVSGYEVRWRVPGEETWRTERIPPGDRWTVTDLVNGQHYIFQLRAFLKAQTSAWTAPSNCVPDPVKESALTSNLDAVPISAWLRLVMNSLWFIWKRRIKYHRE